MTSVDFVFVTTNESEYLLHALDSLFEAEPDLKKFIYVIDNASDDEIGNDLTRRWTEIVTLRRQKRFGLPSNLNFGITSGHSPYVMLCNSDLIFKRDSVSTLIRFMESNDRAGMVGPKLVAPDGALRVSARRWYTPLSLILLKGPWKNWTSRTWSARRSVYDDWGFQGARQVDWLPCPATIIRRSALDEVGLMDERFWVYFDDVDISLRMHEAGWEVWCAADSEVIHLEQRSSVAPFSAPWRWHLSSLLKFWWKHKGLRPKVGTPMQADFDSKFD